MRGSFALQFFDLMVHVLPGVVLVVAVGGLVAPELLVQAGQLDGAVLLVLGFVAAYVVGFVAAYVVGFVAAYVVGFVANSAATTVQGVFGKYALRDRRLLDWHLDRDANVEDAERLAEQMFGLSPSGAETHRPRRALYRHAETVVKDQMSARRTMARRVGALALLSRNLVPAALAMVVVCAARHDAMGAPLAWTLGAGAAVSVPLLLHTWSVYWRRAIDYTFQAYVYWCRRELAGRRAQDRAATSLLWTPDGSSSPLDPPNRARRSR